MSANATLCGVEQPCQGAILSAGYGISYLDYSFITNTLSRLGYMVVSVEHELPGDARIDNAGDLPKQREAIYERGAQNIRFVIGTMAGAYPGYDWRHVDLVGHLIGGDSSAQLANLDSGAITALVTLDNRRARLPRTPATRVLSIRASDTEADPDVLPSPAERAAYQACIVTIGGARHNDMFDGGGAVS